jgi:hypothetical protein
MKNILKSKATASALITGLSLSTLSLLGPMAGPASAGEISKTFELGPGTQVPRSNHRTFNVPSGLPVTARVTYRRLGDPGPQNDIPIVIELRQPGLNATQDGPIVDQKSLLATRDNATITLNGPASSRGCSNPWRVRVRYAPRPNFQPPDPLDPRFDVIGNIQVTFNDDVKQLDISPFNVNIAKGNRVVKDLRGITGSGTVRIRAEWHTSPLELLHINSYYKLTVRLKRNGNIVRTQAGFSQHAPGDKTPKLDFTYFVSPEQVSGTWQLEIESFAPADIVDFHINERGQFVSTLSPGCN